MSASSHRLVLKGRQKNSPRIGGLFFISGGEDGNRTRLNGFTGRCAINEIKMFHQHPNFRLFWLNFSQKLPTLYRYDLAQQYKFPNKIFTLLTILLQAV
jgi:hypothetical protein